MEGEETMYWVMLQTGNCMWSVLGTYKTERWAVRKAETSGSHGRVVVRELQPYGPVVYDTAPETDTGK